MPYGRFRQMEVPYQYRPKIGELYVLNTTNGLTGNRVSVADATADGTIHEYRRCWDHTTPGPPYVVGTGMFMSMLHKPLELSGGVRIQSKPLTTGIPAVVKRQPGDRCVRVYEGAFSLGGGTHGFGSLGTLEGLPDPEIYNELNPDDLTDLGNRAYKLLRPKIEKAGLAQTLAEWRSMPGMLKQSAGGFHTTWNNVRREHGLRPSDGMAGRNRSGQYVGEMHLSPKKAASQFLNVAFGWQPFLKDMGDAFSVLSEFDAYVDRTREMNGKWMRRTRTEDVVESEEVLYQGQSNTNSCSPALQASDFLVPGSCFQTVTRRKTTRVWYTGTFKYYRPEFDYAKQMHPAARRVRQLITALGLRISPSVVYKVTPWTWMLDWFVNVGDFVQRVEDMASDSILSKEFYLMRQSRVELEYRKVFTTLDGQSFDLKWYRSVETKRRGRADSPFHFTPLPGGLSARQLAILAAVGITHW